MFAPLAFYFLVAYLFDRWVALVAAVAFLFAPIGDAPSWVAATYSPWLLTQNCVQTFFYLTLAAYLKALGSNCRPWFVLVGLLLGITFLGHTAPAIILGILMVIGTFQCCIQQAKNGRLSAAGLREVSNLVVILSVAFVVSVPFTFSILGRYHLAIVNHAPNNWKYPLLLASNFSAFVWDNISWCRRNCNSRLFQRITFSSTSGLSSISFLGSAWCLDVGFWQRRSCRDFFRPWQLRKIVCLPSRRLS